MKKIVKLFVLLVVISITTIYSQDWQSNDVCSVANDSMKPDTIPGSNWRYPTIFNWQFENIGTPEINGGSVGAIYFQNKYYFNRWNTTIMYRYDGGWDGPSSFLDSITYVGSIRDLTTDGQYLYGGSATSTVYKIDSDGTTIGTITLGSPAVARAIAYSPDENGFYVCNYNDNIVLCDATTGAVIRTLTGTNTLTGKYGMAYSNMPNDVPTLWVWGQGTITNPYNNLWKVNPATGDTITTYRFGPLTVIKGATSPSGIAGGAEVCVINKSSILLLNYQNYALVGYRIGDALPVELTSFMAKVAEGKVNLNWSTASELNNRGFEIQRSPSNGQFVTIAFVNGSGTSTETHNYCFNEKTPKAGKYTYRLRQVDYNGHSEYSKKIAVEIAPGKFELIQNYPNPFNPNTTINFNLATDSRVSVKVFNLLGQEVAILLNGEFSAGTHSVKFDASQLSSGIYLYWLEASNIGRSNFIAVKKMIYIK